MSVPRPLHLTCQQGRQVGGRENQPYDPFGKETSMKNLPGQGQDQAGAAFVWQEVNRMTSSAPGLALACSCAPHPPWQTEACLQALAQAA